MRALTVRQPWAWAIVHGGKDVENRTRSLGPYRGPVAIHASLSEAPLAEWTPQLHGAMAERFKDSGDVVRDVLGTRGVVIGVADLVDVLPPPYYDRAEADEAWCSEWAQEGHYQLVLENPRPLARPIPWRGRLGLWTVPADLEAAIREQVAA